MNAILPLILFLCTAYCVKSAPIRLVYVSRLVKEANEEISNIMLKKPTKSKVERKKVPNNAEFNGSRTNSLLENAHFLRTFSFEDFISVVQNVQILKTFANMAYNAYLESNSHNRWKDTLEYQLEKSFGWDGIGLRGYAYQYPQLKVMVLAFKGTSAAFLGVGGNTASADKAMDNFMFSCCCGSISRLFAPSVCECASAENVLRCDAKCLAASVTSTDSYYHMAKRIYADLKGAFPTHTFIFTGHSLGASLAAMLAATFKDTYAVSFCSPGDRLYAGRIGLPFCDDFERIVHIGASSDPIFTGKCNGFSSMCYIAGYAMDSKCHSGIVCTFKGSPFQSIATHTMGYMLSYVLNDNEAKGFCRTETSCRDCEDWQFY